jgi:hypothetical protein
MLASKYLRLSVVAALLVLGLRQSALAATYYLSPSGVDSTNNGASIATAWRSLSYAASQVKPGDTVYALTGDYSAPDLGNAMIMTTAGLPNAWIRFKAYPGAHPILHSASWEAIEIRETVSYFELSGFEIVGDNQNVTLAEAQAQPEYGAPQFNTIGVNIDGMNGSGTTYPHHIVVRDNIIHDCGGYGISGGPADYIWITGNTVYNNAWYSVYGNSGISIGTSWSSDSYTGHKIFITGNRVYGNRNYIPYVFAGRITDGEGIILDTNNNYVGNHNLPPYNGRFLIANNIAYNNGSSGILAFESDNADIVNNSTYENLQTESLNGGGELDIYASNNSSIINNIFESSSGLNPVQNVSWAPCTNCTVNRNIYFGGTIKGGPFGGPQDVTGNPLYLDPAAADLSKVDLRVSLQSPAINRGEHWIDHYVDFNLFPRPFGQGDEWDIGAYEYDPYHPPQ